MLMVLIKDNGIGIDEEVLGRIFDRFYRADDSRTQETGGTGLGLSIVQQVVKLHGGTIEVASIKGKAPLLPLCFQSCNVLFTFRSCWMYKIRV